MTIVRTVLPTDPAWLKLAFKHLGLSEIKGPKHNKEILAFYRDAGFPGIKDDETPWCAAFTNAILKRSKLPGTNSLAARSFLNWGKDTTSPTRGDIVVFKRGTGWQGHVAFYLGETKSHITVLGGNQSNKVSVANYAKKDLLSYRTPMDFRPIMGNSNTTKQASMQGGGLAMGVASEAVSQADVAAPVLDAGSQLSNLGTISMWLGIIGAALIIGGTFWMVSERMGWWEKKGF